jgi:hypothetical protein
MLSVSKELKNIPISISILHEQEYNNLCNIYKFNIKIKSSKRRAYSDQSGKKNSRIYQFNNTLDSYSLQLENK